MHVLLSDTFIVTKNIPDIGITGVRKKKKKLTIGFVHLKCKQTKKQSCQQHWINFCVEQDTAKVLLLLHSFPVYGIFVIHWYLNHSYFFKPSKVSKSTWLKNQSEDFVTAVTTSQSLCTYLFSFTTSSWFFLQLYSHKSGWCNYFAG